jgi:hypothetical protein
MSLQLDTLYWFRVIQLLLTTDLANVTDKLYHIMVYRVHIERDSNSQLKDDISLANISPIEIWPPDKLLTLLYWNKTPIVIAVVYYFKMFDCFLTSVIKFHSKRLTIIGHEQVDQRVETTQPNSTKVTQPSIRCILVFSNNCIIWER